MDNFERNYRLSLEYDAKAAQARRDADAAHRSGKAWLSDQLERKARYYDRRALVAYGAASGIPAHMC